VKYKLLGRVKSLVIRCGVRFLSNEVNGSWWPHCMSLRGSGTSDCLDGWAKEGVAQAAPQPT